MPMNPQYQALLGKKLVADNVAPGPKEFRASDLPAGTRVLPPNSMMTMDFRPDRLNVHLDGTDTVVKVIMG